MQASNFFLHILLKLRVLVRGTFFMTVILISDNNRILICG
jgi:hypothetical protein